ncbi:MAG: prepilin-type N-terminal cleavage/methylation domain-containing protein [Piscirickettsiaceae bacterium]|nr:prepilin-type N-terminal cleavage/methylation domain-containing protein [Piscirickettsiaceae bacterium]
MMDQKQKGFTLIELMVVVVILGVLVAIAFPSFVETLDRRKLKGAGDKLFADLLFAKTEAIKRNTPVRITFKGNGATWCYGIAENVACDCTAADCVIDGVSKVVNQDDYSAAVSVDGTASFAADDANAFTSFTPLRGAANAGNLQFSIASGAELRVVVSSFGRVRLCSDTGAFGHAGC